MSNCDLKQIITLLEAHQGLFIIDNITYDDVLYCGNDNLYFSYCFNCTTNRAVSEALFIVDTIAQTSEQIFVIKSGNSEVLVFLKE